MQTDIKLSWGKVCLEPAGKNKLQATSIGDVGNSSNRIWHPTDGDGHLDALADDPPHTQFTMRVSRGDEFVWKKERNTPIPRVFVAQRGSAFCSTVVGPKGYLRTSVEDISLTDEGIAFKIKRQAGGTGFSEKTWPFVFDHLQIFQWGDLSLEVAFR